MTNSNEPLPKSRKFPALIWIERMFTLDVRSLALFRVALALLLIFDLMQRSPDLVAFYTDSGVLPRTALIQAFPQSQYRLCFHLINGSAQFQIALFAIAFLFAVALLIGFRTWWATFFSWLLLVSLETRNPLVNDGSYLLHLFLFWSLFLPLGSCYSIDRALDTSGSPPLTRVASIGTFALVLQICVVYWFSAVLKNHPIWTQEGTAIYYALSLDKYATPVGQLLYSNRSLMKALTFATLWFEFIGPVLAILIWRGSLRFAIVCFFIAFHIGLESTLSIGLFSYACIIGWLIFIPTWFWERINNRGKALKLSRFSIYYDKDCGFCKKMAFIIHNFFAPQVGLPVEAQQDADIYQAMQEKNSWVIVGADGTKYYKFQAFIHICQQNIFLRKLTWLLRLRPVSSLGDTIYEAVASHRVLAARFISFFEFGPCRSQSFNVAQGAASVFILYALLINMRSIDAKRYEFPFLTQVDNVLRLAALEQRWNVFAPYPSKNNGWFAIVGTLKNGKNLDLDSLKEANILEKPVANLSFIKSPRWRKYRANIMASRHRRMRPHYGSYLWKKWNSEHPASERLTSLKIYFVDQYTLPDYNFSEPKARLLWSFTRKPS